MRRDRDRDHRDNSDDFDNTREPGSSNRSGNDETESAAEMQLRAFWMLDEVIRMTPRNDPRLGVLLALREQLETDEAMMDEARKVIAEFEEAYNKLTAPANRIGVYLGGVEPEAKPKPRARFGRALPEEPKG